jgi:hypothetical protein
MRRLYGVGGGGWYEKVVRNWGRRLVCEGCKGLREEAGMRRL